jgi:hypothetical protein
MTLEKEPPHGQARPTNHQAGARHQPGDRRLLGRTPGMNSLMVAVDLCKNAAPGALPQDASALDFCTITTLAPAGEPETTDT